MSHYGNDAIYLLLFAILLQLRGILDNTGFMGFLVFSVFAIILSFWEK